MKRNVTIDVTFPRSGLTYKFRSIHAVARMLSGNGTASGGLRKTISERAWAGVEGRVNNRVRGHQLVG